MVFRVNVPLVSTSLTLLDKHTALTALLALHTTQPLPLVIYAHLGSHPYDIVPYLGHLILFYFSDAGFPAEERYILRQ
jgi:hypothetical protein